MSLPAPFDADFSACPYRGLGEIRESADAVRVLSPSGRPTWLVTRDADVRRLLLDPRLSMRDPASPGSSGKYGGFSSNLASLDAPEHTLLRRIVAPAFSASRMQRFKPRLEAIASALGAAVCTAEGDAPFDLMNEFAKPYSFTVLYELFGFTPRRAEEFLGWLTSQVERVRYSPATVSADAARLESFVADELRLRYDAPRADVLSSIIAEWRRQGAAEAVSESDLVTLCLTVVLAGFDSTAQMIGICFAGLLAHPETTAAVRAEAELLPRVIDELLRWQSPGPVATPRWATADIELSDATVAAGDEVLLSVAAANRDPRRYEAPDRLDPNRAPGPIHLAFGLGAHHCLGASLAKLELVVALCELLRRMPDATLAVPLQDVSWSGKYSRRIDALPVYPRDPRQTLARTARSA